MGTSSPRPERNSRPQIICSTAPCPMAARVSDSSKCNGAFAARDVIEASTDA